MTPLIEIIRSDFQPNRFHPVWDSTWGCRGDKTEAEIDARARSRAIRSIGVRCPRWVAVVLRVPSKLTGHWLPGLFECFATKAPL